MSSRFKFSTYNELSIKQNKDENLEFKKNQDVLAINNYYMENKNFKSKTLNEIFTKNVHS
jgi:hypothetical protein